jgi:Tol biopolymer transport system component
VRLSSFFTKLQSSIFFPLLVIAGVGYLAYERFGRAEEKRCLGILGERSEPCLGVRQPTWSPGGGQIAFVDDRPSGTPQLYVVRLDGSEQQRLTFDGGYADEPAWSPDGKRLVFVWASGPFAFERALFVVNSDGSGRRRVTRPEVDASAPVWSSDGSQIGFSDDGSAFKVVAARGGVAERAGSTAAWSRYGLLRGAEAGVGQAILLLRSGAEPRQLTHPASRVAEVDVEDRYPVWSPDGTRVAFARSSWRLERSRIGVVDRGGRHLRLLTDHHRDEHPSWSPDGRKIAFSRDGKLYVMNSDGTDVSLIIG